MDGAIYKAVESDNPEDLKALIARGANVNEYYHDYTLISAKSILHICCEKGRLECAKILLENGADPAICDTWYQTPLMYCMLTQYHEIAEFMLAHSPECVDIGDKYGKSALHIAVQVGSEECVTVMLQNNADVNITTDYGVTPLITACSSKSLDHRTVVNIVRLLLEHGADHRMKDYRNKRTALQTAVVSKNVEAVELLLSVGSDPNTLDSAGRCPLTNVMWEFARNIGGRCEIDPDVMSIIMLLIQAGASPNISKTEQSNALVIATLLKATPLVWYLLENGGNQNQDFYCGITPLLIAVTKKDIDTINALLNWKSDLYREGRVRRAGLDYFTDAFRLAIDIGAFDIAILLAEAGYNMSRVRYLVDWSSTPPDSLIDNQIMLEFFRQSAQCVKTLFHITVGSIRNCLSSDITRKSAMLPLPKSLISAIGISQDVT